MANCTCWTAGCTGACAPTGCAPHACQNSCQGCGGSCTGSCDGCSGCSGSCSGSCQGGCKDTCNNTCQGGCRGDCTNSCLGTCNNLCNTGCSNETATSLAAKLSLDEFITAANMNDVQSLLKQEAARRPGVSVADVNFIVGDAAEATDFNEILTNLRNVGQTMTYVAKVGNTISRSVGADLIQKALASYNTKVEI